MTEQDFYPTAEKIYKDNLEVFAELNKRRNWDLVAVTVTAIIISPLAVTLLFFMTIRLQLSYFPTVPLMIALYPVCWIVMYTNFNLHYRNFVKHRFLYALAERLGLKYRRGGAIPLGDLYDHHVLPPYGGHECEEGFHGRIKGFDIAFQDFTVRGVPRLDRFDYRALLTRQFFYGIAVRIELNRNFGHHTVLMPSFMANGRMKRIFNAKFSDHEDVGIVFRKFNDNYTILSTNQVEARVIFDPAMIERIMALGEMLDAYWLEISFKDREMVIVAGQSKNFFEVGTLLKPPSVLTIEKVLAELNQLKSILDVLEMNPLTGVGTVLPNRT